MMQILIVLLAAVLLIRLLYYEYRRDQKGRLPTKTVLSSLFILAAVAQPHPIPGYYYLLLVGLIFCLCGDVCLALPRERPFVLGLVAFLVGHLFYICAFFYVSQTNLWAWVGFLLAVFTSSLVFFRLNPYLGTMKLPVFLYVVVITIMVTGAWSVLGHSSLARSGRIMVFMGALSFYFSDLFVARNRFVKKDPLNRLIGLPMYYTGQFLLAFSVGLLK
jgi:uncharacterized membrane protein YhhN